MRAKKGLPALILVGLLSAISSRSATGQLSIAPTSNSAVSISWPANNGAISLQTTTNLGGSTDWETLILEPFEDQGMFKMMVPVDTTTTKRFFRLDYSLPTNSYAPFAFPQLTITLPVTNFSEPFRTNAATVTLAGTVDDPNAVVMVQGNLVPVTGTNWVTNAVSLPQEGGNIIVISATNAVGARTVEYLTIARSTAVPPPVGLQALAIGPGTNQLTWLPSPESDVVLTRIYRRTNSAGSTYALVSTVDGSATLFYDGSIPSGGSFDYEIQTVDGFGNQSPFSAEAACLSFGAASGNGLFLTGGSVDASGNTSSTVAATVLNPVIPIQTTNGAMRVRYIGYDGLVYNSTQSYEIPGPDLMQLYNFSELTNAVRLPGASGNPVFAKYQILAENDTGFGSSVTVDIVLPPGFTFDPPLGTVTGTSYYGPIFVYGVLPGAIAAGYGPPALWDPARSIFLLGNPEGAILVGTSNEITLTATFPVLSNYTVNPPLPIGAPSVVGIALDLTEDTLGQNLIVNSNGIAEPAPKVQITVNGTKVEAGLGLPLDPEPNALVPLRKTVDDAGGEVNLLTGDYGFKVPLFKGQGQGINLDCWLAYSSWNTFHAYGALQQPHPENYTFLPFGPGWGYPYGMRLIPASAMPMITWVNGVGVTNGPGRFYLVCPDGRVTPVYGTNGVGCSIHRPAPKWARFSHAEIVTNQTGYAIVETTPTNDGFQEIDFDFQGRLIKIIPHGGLAPLVVSYAGTAQTVTDSSSRSAQFIYDSTSFTGRVVAINDPGGGHWVATYSSGALVALQETNSGYGWQFAYDATSYNLTERRLPHGFTIQSCYAAPPPVIPNPTNFFWGTLAQTRWKETPSNSTRHVTFLQNFKPGSATPDRVTITLPSSRNTLFFDRSGATNTIYNDQGGDTFVSVVESDQMEGNPNQLRFWSNEQAYNPWEYLDVASNAAGGVITEAYYGQYPNFVIREDFTARTFSYSGLTSWRSASSETDWRGLKTQYTYANPQTLQERLVAVYPPGQNPGGTNAHSIQFGYDASNRVQFITNMDGNVTEYVYAGAGNLGLPQMVIPLYNLSPPAGPGQGNPYTWTYGYDGLGRTTSVTDPNQNTTLYFYDTAGRLTNLVGPTNPAIAAVPPQTRYTYQGALLKQQSSLNPGGLSFTTTYVYDNQARLTDLVQPGSDPANPLSVTTYTYDADGNVTNVLYPNGGTQSLSYDNRGRMTNSVGPQNETMQYTYDDTTDGIVTATQVDGATRRTATVTKRDALRRVMQVTLPSVTQGGVTGSPQINLGYNADSEVSLESYAFGGLSNTVTATYGNFNELLTRVRDMGGGQGVKEQFTSDYEGRTTQEYGLQLSGLPISPGAANIQFETNRSASLATYSQSPFSTVSNIFNTFGLQCVSVSVDGMGQTKAVQVPNPAVFVPTNGPAAVANTLAWGLTRDNWNLVNGMADVFSNATTILRNPLAEVQSVTDPNGTAVNEDYTTAGDPASTTTVSAGGATLDATRAEHDNLGNSTQVLGPGNNGGGTLLQYDFSGRLTNWTDAAGNSAIHQYNGFDELTNQVYPDGSHITYSRDALGRVTSSTEYAANGTATCTETTGYDVFGRVSSLEDGNYRHEYVWDNLGRILTRRTVFKALGVTNKLEYRYGQYGGLLSLTGSEGFTMNYRYDSDDNLLESRITAPGGDTEHVYWHPDGVGRLQGWQLASGSSTVASASLTWDQKGRLKQMSYASPGISLVPYLNLGYSYDALDRITNIVDHAKGRAGALGYDPRGYLEAETWTRLSDGGVEYRDRINYDAAGNRDSRVLNGNLTQYKQDTTYQLTNETTRTQIPVLEADIQTSADSTYGPGYAASLAITQQAPDSEAAGSGWRSGTNAAAHWLELDLTNTVELPISAVDVSVPTDRGGLGEFQIELAPSPAGPFTPAAIYPVLQGYNVSTNTAGTHEHTVQVTLLEPQLAGAVRVEVPEGGEGVNPLTLAKQSDVIINGVTLYTATNEVIARSYDANGRLTNDGVFTYGYDVQGRLTGVVGPGVNKTWTITPEGLRGSETDHLTGQTRYIANDGANASFEFAMSGNQVVPLLRHFPGGGADTHLGFYEYTNGQPVFRWTLTDSVGSVRQVLDTNGNVLDDRAYTAWGEDLVPPTVQSANPYGFAGARKDLETGLYYNRARMYDPAVGRFQAKDPAGMIDGPNDFLYAGNDPVGGRDPSGLDQWDLLSLDDKATRSAIAFAILSKAADSLPGRAEFSGVRESLRAQSDYLWNLYQEYDNKARAPSGPSMYSIQSRNANVNFKITVANQKRAQQVQGWTQVNEICQNVLAARGNPQCPEVVREVRVNTPDVGGVIDVPVENIPENTPAVVVRPPGGRLPKQSAPEGAAERLQIPSTREAIASAKPGTLLNPIAKDVPNGDPTPFIYDVSMIEKGLLKVKISDLVNPRSRPEADADKLERQGEWNEEKYTPAIVLKKRNGVLEIQDGVTRIENARRAGETHIRVKIFEEK